MPSSDVPLHTRMLSLRLVWGAIDRIDAAARIFDLRKRGIVPLAGKLQGPGVVHDMAVRLEIDYPSLRIAAIEPSMSAFPFAPGPATRGEGCPDRLPDVQRLRGDSLTADYGDRLMRHIGGPRGCFHVFTLLRLLGPAVEAVARRAQQSGTTPVVGCPLFARSVIIDGSKGDGLSLNLRGMLFDLHYPPRADTLPLEEELEESFEAIADVTVQIPAMTIGHSAARIRRSGPGLGVVGQWEPVATAEALAGRPMQKGYTAGVQQLFAGTAGLEPLQHVLFMMAPAMIQCFPSLAEELEIRPRRAEGPHAAVDSCHMWRADGPLVAVPPWPGRS
jgi:hypothetical protein